MDKNSEEAEYKGRQIVSYDYEDYNYDDYYYSPVKRLGQSQDYYYYYADEYYPHLERQTQFSGLTLPLSYHLSSLQASII